MAQNEGVASVLFVGFKTPEDAERFRERAMTEARHMGLFDVSATLEEFPDLKKLLSEFTPPCAVCGSLEHRQHEVSHP